MPESRESGNKHSRIILEWLGKHFRRNNSYTTTLIILIYFYYSYNLCIQVFLYQGNDLTTNFVSFVILNKMSPTCWSLILLPPFHYTFINTYREYTMSFDRSSMHLVAMSFHGRDRLNGFDHGIGWNCGLVDARCLERILMAFDSSGLDLFKYNKVIEISSLCRV